MSNEELLSLLNNLGNNKSYDFNAVVLTTNAYLGYDSSNNITLLLKTNYNFQQSYSTNLLSLSLGLKCNIKTDQEDIQGKFHIIKCKTQEKELNYIFIVLCRALLEDYSIETESNEIISWFNNLEQLFKISPSSDLLRARQGLWAELFLLRKINAEFSFTKYWHLEPNRKFDFSFDNYRIEVKSTTGEERVHYFSHNQIFRNDKVEIVIVSLILQYEDSGLSLGELITEARTKLSNNFVLLTKLEKAIRSAGMNDVTESGPRFDEMEAGAKLLWFREKDLPKFNQPEPEGVSGTKYKINMSNAANMSDLHVNSWLDNWK